MLTSSFKSYNRKQLAKVMSFLKFTQSLIMTWKKLLSYNVVHVRSLKYHIALTACSIGRKVIQPFSALASDFARRSGRLVELVAINAGAAAGSCTLTQATVVRRELNSSRTNTSCTLVKRVPVAGHRGLIRER